MREVLGRKGATMGLLRAARGAGARAPPRRGWPLSENGDGRLLNTLLLSICDKTDQIKERYINILHYGWPIAIFA